MRAFKTKWFDRFARKMGISDTKLTDITIGLGQGRWDTDLGGDVYKIRVARPGEGKSGGYRTIVLFRKNERAFFVYGFAKSDKDNIEDWELKHYRESAEDLLALPKAQIEAMLGEGTLIEIITEAKNEQKI
ncbi:MAG: type II toxin-antitoxin system RelE/ParE family toxin [Treponema sp.]|nr:type II toxin-antitoxin system RelE/ParE family toxin [Treponema sp.]